jgi:hypothetical protein
MSRQAVAISTIITLLSLALAACHYKIPKNALALSPESLKDRQLQTRIFETDDEKMLLTASAAVLQDSGYTIEESEVSCGVIVSARDRDVTETGQVVGSIVLGVCLGAPVPWDVKQRVEASLVTKPIDDKRIAVRITFQHVIWNNHNQVSKREQINDPEIYEEFFAKLSKSLFLTAHEIGV